MLQYMRRNNDEMYIPNIRDYLNFRAGTASTDAQIGDTGLAKKTEGFLCDFLNHLLGCSLKDANTEERRNFPAIDLIDKQKRYVVQVSVIHDPSKIKEKINESIKNFCIPDDGEWHFFYVQFTVGKIRIRDRDDFPGKSGIIFDPKKDILTISRMMELAKTPTTEDTDIIDKLKELSDLVDRYQYPQIATNKKEKYKKEIKVGLYCIIVTLFVGVLALFIILNSKSNDNSQVSTVEAWQPNVAEQEAIQGPAISANEGSSPLFGAWQLVHAEHNGEILSLPKHFTVCWDGSVFSSYPPNSNKEESHVQGVTVVEYKSCNDSCYYATSILDNLLQQLKKQDFLKIDWRNNEFSVQSLEMLAGSANPIIDNSSYFFLNEVDESDVIPKSVEITTPEPIKEEPNEFDLNQTFICKNKYLVIHVTAETENKMIDSWYLYQREDRMLGLYLNLSLVGTWTDKDGNTWKFEADPQHRLINFFINYSVGSPLIGTNFTYSDKRAELDLPYECIQFYFSDNQEPMRDFDIVYYDGILLYLLDRDNKGKPFWLIRN